jgi:hypothetical protein
MTPSLTTHRSSRILALGAGVALAVASCGGNATESGIEKLIEQQTGGDVDLDFDNGSGGFSIDTEEGSMRMDADGNFVVTGPDGEVITGNADSETGGFAMESADGSFRVSDDGSFPEEWPSEIPQPSGYTVASSTYMSDGDGLATIALVGASPQGVTEFAESYGSTLESAGFEQTAKYEADDFASIAYEGNGWTVMINGTGSDVQITIGPA